MRQRQMGDACSMAPAMLSLEELISDRPLPLPPWLYLTSCLTFNYTSTHTGEVCVAFILYYLFNFIILFITILALPPSNVDVVIVAGVLGEVLYAPN